MITSSRPWGCTAQEATKVEGKLLLNMAERMTRGQADQPCSWLQSSLALSHAELKRAVIIRIEEREQYRRVGAAEELEVEVARRVELPAGPRRVDRHPMGIGGGEAQEQWLAVDVIAERQRTRVALGSHARGKVARRCCRFR